MERFDITLKEAITLILEPTEDFIKDAKAGTIGKSPRLQSAVSCLKEFIKNGKEKNENSKQPFGTRDFGFPTGRNNQELELLSKRVDILTEVTEIFGPILERLETLEAKMSKIEKEVS
jgi:hypothetical protein